MRGGSDSAEGYVKAMEYGAPALVAAGLMSREQVKRALARARSPDFAILSPLAVIARGRRRA
jgi:hypothetical protein